MSNRAMADSCIGDYFQNTTIINAQTAVGPAMLLLGVRGVSITYSSTATGTLVFQTTDIDQMSGTTVVPPTNAAQMPLNSMQVTMNSAITNQSSASDSRWTTMYVANPYAKWGQFVFLPTSSGILRAAVTLRAAVSD